MSRLFADIVNISYLANWLIMAVIVFRCVMKRAPKWMVCLMWGMVAIRLVIPFQLESSFCLVPDVGKDNMEVEFLDNDALEMNRKVANAGDESLMANGTFHNQKSVAQNGIGMKLTADKMEHTADGEEHTFYKGKSASETEMDILAVVWLLGAVVILINGIWRYALLKRRVSASVLKEENIYLCDEIDSPFLLGIMHPCIYLPSDMNECFYESVLRHEYAHIKRKDYIWKPLGFAILSVYWFNPLCWAAYLLFGRDVELACDEMATACMDKEERADYCQTLLNYNVNRGMRPAVPLAFGEVGVKKRVKEVLRGKKPTFWGILVAIVIGIGIGVCFLTSPKQEETKEVKEPVQSVESGVTETDMLEDTEEDDYTEEDDDYTMVFEKKANLERNSKGEWKPVPTTKVRVLKNESAQAARVKINCSNGQKFEINCKLSKPVWKNVYLVRENNKHFILEFTYEHPSSSQVDIQYQLYDFVENSETKTLNKTVVVSDHFIADGAFSVEDFNRVTDPIDDYLENARLLVRTQNGEFRFGPENDYETFNSKVLYYDIMAQGFGSELSDRFAYVIDYKYGEGFILDCVGVFDSSQKDWAEELGLTEENISNGLYIYNDKVEFVTVKESEDCVYTILEGKNHDEPREISRTQFAAVARQQSQRKENVLYIITMKGDEIVEIRERSAG